MIHEVKLIAEHLMGSRNTIPDLLSRFHENDSICSEFYTITCGLGLKFVTIDPKLFRLTHEW